MGDSLSHFELKLSKYKDAIFSLSGGRRLKRNVMRWALSKTSGEIIKQFVSICLEYFKRYSQAVFLK